MEWTKSDTLKIVKLWHGLPCLWNHKGKSHKDKQKRREALLHVSEQLGVDVIAVEKKLVSLKTQYNRELKKISTHTTDEFDDNNKSMWYAFEYLHFLKDHNATQTNPDPLMLIQAKEEIEENSVSDEHFNRTESYSIIVEEDYPSPQTQHNDLKRKYDCIQSSTPKNESKSVITTLDKDEFTTFGETIATELREIKSRRDLLVVKKEIMDVIYLAKIKIFDTEKGSVDE